MDPPPDAVVLDAVQVEFLLPAGAGEAVAAAARAALDEPAFLAAVGRAVQAVLAAAPALAPLSARAAW